MRHRIRADLFGDLDLLFRNQRARNRGAEQILPFINRVGAEHREHIIAHEFLAQILDENVFRLDAEQERLLSEITATARSSTDINLILQTAMQELAEALRIPRGAIQLRRTETQQAAREKPKGAKPVDGASSSANNVAPASTMQGDDVHA